MSSSQTFRTFRAGSGDGRKPSRPLALVVAIHLAAAALPLAFSSCGPVARAKAKSEKSGPVRVQIGGEPSTLDPARVLDQYGMGILRNVVEGLYKLDSDGHLQKGLAASHTVSKDGLVYKFKIRPDAKWSDGKPVSIDDLVFGLQHALDPKTAATNADSLFAIKNARNVFEGKLPVSALGVSRSGEELVIELERPDPLLLLELTLPLAAPVRKDMLEANKGSWNYKFPVTGRYSIASYQPSDRIELVPNPYNSTAGQRPVLYRILSEEVTAMNLFQAGQLEVLSTITSTEIAPLRKQGLVRDFPSTTVFYFSFNHQKAPFNDPDWRRAIASSVDREGLSKALHGVFEPTSSYLPKMIDGALPYKATEAGPASDKVRGLKNKPVVRMAYGASAFTKTVAEKIQHDLEKKLGLKLVLEPMELKTLLARLKSDPPEMYFLGMSAIYNDPINQLQAFTNTTEPNFSRYRNPAFDKLVEEIRLQPIGAKRTELAREANRILIEKDVALVPMVLRTQVFGVSKSLQGFKVSPYQVIQLDQIR